MSNPLGGFHPEIVPEGWFDQTAQAGGWFDKDNLTAAAASGAPYSLPVSTAAVTLTGSTIALRRALRLSVSTAAVTLTGSEIALSTTSAASTVAGYPVSDAIAKQRERRRKRVLEQLRSNKEPTVERLQEAIETTVSTVEENPEQSAEMLSLAKGYLSNVPEQSSAQIILALATLAELEAALNASAFMRQAQMLREEEDMIAFLMLT